MELTPAALGLETIRLAREKLESNPVPFAVDDLPELTETEPNNGPRAAMPVTVPVIVNGRVSQPGDWDVFSFTGKAGQTLVAEVMARRLNSPLDSVLRLVDAAGKTVAAASTLDKDLKGNLPKGSDLKAATAVGKLVAERALQAGVKDVIFDRGGYLYLGRVKALAEAAREAGLNF